MVKDRTGFEWRYLATALSIAISNGCKAIPELPAAPLDGGGPCQAGAQKCRNNDVYRCKKEEWVLYDQCEIFGETCRLIYGNAQCVAPNGNDTGTDYIASEGIVTDTISPPTSDTSSSADGGTHADTATGTERSPAMK